MKKLKTLSLTLSLSTLILILPYINAYALPIINTEDNQDVITVNTLNTENKIVKRNQKEKMAEILVNIYNKYNSILKQGIESNDIKNSDLYINITKQKTDIKILLDDIINYPYSVVSSEIEDRFLKHNIIFCTLSNNYIYNELPDISVYNSDILYIKTRLNNILDILNLSVLSLKIPGGNYSLEKLNNDITKLSNLINSIYDIKSFQSHKSDICKIINNTCMKISSILSEYNNI